MIKEFKYLFYIFSIFFFIFFTAKYYFSTENKKNSYRSIQTMENTINNYLENLPILESDTENIIEYVEKANDQNKKIYNFWKLIIKND